MRSQFRCITGVVLAALTLAPAAASAEHARRVEFRIENLTNAITFRPFLVAAHAPEQPVFRAGQPATDDSRFAGVQLMAECGALGPAPVPNLVDRMRAAGADLVANPVNLVKPFDPPLGLLFPAGIGPGDTVVPFGAGIAGAVEGALRITSRRNTHLSVVAMLLPTNDAFAGLDSVEIPRKPGTYVYHLPAYDAGTEANDEVQADPDPLDCVAGEPGYPVDPLGNTGAFGTGVDGPDVARRVHVHRNQLGDRDPGGGDSDLDSRIHRWLNPVVKLTITVPRGNGHGPDGDDDDRD